MGLILSVPAPAAVPLPPRLTSYRYWGGYQAETLHAIRDIVGRVLDDKERQFDLFAAAAPECSGAGAQAHGCTAAPVNTASPTEEKNSTLGAVLSPSQVNTFLTCSTKWWFKYGAGLPDPKGGSLVRGLAVHKLVEYWFRQKLAGNVVEVDDLSDTYDAAWEAVAADAHFANDDDPEELKRQGAQLLRKYLEEVAPELDVTQIEQPVDGEIAGIKVRGFIDLMASDGTIIDVKTAAKKPSGLDSGYRLQLATYRQLAPRANGRVRLDTLVATKTPQLVKIEYETTVADQLMTQHLYPLVREGMREGLYFPNRGSNLCSCKYCNFAEACCKEFGGDVQ